MEMYPGINLNALLPSIKIILGYLCWLIVAILLFVLFHHYGEFNYRILVLFRKFLREIRSEGISYNKPHQIP